MGLNLSEISDREFCSNINKMPRDDAFYKRLEQVQSFCVHYDKEQDWYFVIISDTQPNNSGAESIDYLSLAKKNYRVGKEKHFELNRIKNTNFKVFKKRMLKNKL